MGFFNKMFGGKGAGKSPAETRRSGLMDALSMQQSGEFDGSLEVLRAIARSSEEDSLAAFFSAVALAGKGNVAEAAQSLRALSAEISRREQAISREVSLGLFSAVGDDDRVTLPSVAELIAAFGDRLKGEDFLQESAVAFEIAATLAPDNPQLLHKLGDTLHDLRLYEYAETVLKQALGRAPNHWGALYTYAVLLQDIGRFDEAIGCYQRAVRLNPDHPRCRNNYGAALLMTGRFDEALEQCSAAAKLDPTAPLTRVNLGNIYLQMQQYQNACTAFKEAIALDENLALAYFGLGSAERGLGSGLDQVRDLYLKAIELNPAMPQFQHGLGSLLAEEGNPQALAHFSAAAQLNGKLSNLQRDFGSACLKLGMREEALAHLREALRQDPEDAAAQEMLALAEKG